MGTIKGIIEAIKGLVEMFRSLKDLVAFYNKEVKEQWYTDSRKIVEEIRAAQTDEERASLAKRLAEHGLFK